MSNYKLQITKLQKGMSLLEILVVVAIFSILGVIVTRSVLLTLRGSKKSESQVKVRENVNYALAVIERQLRNADSIVTCPNDPSFSDNLFSKFTAFGRITPATSKITALIINYDWVECIKTLNHNLM